MRFDKQKFRDTTITLDFNEFYGCSFKGCTLIFHGYSGTTLSGCDMTGATFVFGGPAGLALKMLGAFHADPGLRPIAQQTMDNIAANDAGRPVVLH